MKGFGSMKEIMDSLAREFGINPRELKKEKQKHKNLNIWARALRRLREEGNGTAERYKELLAEEEALKKGEPTPRKPQSYDEFIEQVKNQVPMKMRTARLAAITTRLIPHLCFGR